MSALVFILKRSLINTVKNLAKKPAALVAYVVIAAFFIFGVVMSSINSSPDQKPLNQDIVETILLSYIIFILATSIISSLAGGNTFFRLADVNMLFTAPIKAGSILIYGFVKQLATTLMLMVFVSIQYPNWKRMFGLVDGAGWVLAAGYIFLLMISSFLGIIIYSFISRKPGRKTLMKLVLASCLVLFFAPVLFMAMESGNILNSIVDYFCSAGLGYVPIIGWLRELMAGAVYGYSINVSINLVLLFVLSISLLLYVYRMDTGFYEEAVAGAEIKESLMKSMRSGKSGTAYKSQRKYRKVRFEFTSVGARAIYQRQILEQRKTGVLFIGARTLFLLAAAVIAALTVKADGNLLLTIFLLASVYIMMIFNMAGTWEGELSKHYIYLVPSTSWKKLFYSTLPMVIKQFVEGVVIFTISGILAGSSPTAIVSAITAYTMIGASFTYSDVFVRRLFGKVHGKVLRIFFRVLLLLLILVPAITVSAMIIISTGLYALAFLAVALINFVLSLLFILTGTGLFDNPEFD